MAKAPTPCFGEGRASILLSHVQRSSDYLSDAQRAINDSGWDRWLFWRLPRLFDDEVVSISPIFDVVEQATVRDTSVASSQIVDV